MMTSRHHRRAAWRIVVLAWLALVLPCRAAPAADAPPWMASPQALRDAVARAMRFTDLDELQRILQDARRPEAKFPDGTHALYVFDGGLGWAMNGSPGYGIAYFKEMAAYTHGLALAHPDSPLAAYLYADALRNEAWHVRGTGYANTVSDEQMAEFLRLNRAASDFLAGPGRPALREALTYPLLIAIGRALGWSFDQQWAVAQAGLDINPEYDEIYFAVLQGTLPKWGGDADLVDRFIALAVARTRAQRGLEMYARLYSDASDEDFGADVFKDTRIDWRMMKQGFLDFLSRHGDAMRYNTAAHFACLARDRAMYQSMIAHIGASPQTQQWGVNGQSTYEVCQRWAATP